MDFQQKIREEQIRDKINIIKATLPEIEKGGEGSRGGKIIGRTKSGQPIYAKSHNMPYETYSKEDHKDAAEAHSFEHRSAEDKLENTHDPVKRKQLQESIKMHRENAEGHIRRGDSIQKSAFDEFEPDMENIEKSLHVFGKYLGEEELDKFEKSINHKYFKREPVAGGGYKYYYTEADYKKEKGVGENKSDESDKLVNLAIASLLKEYGNPLSTKHRSDGSVLNYKKNKFFVDLEGNIKAEKKRTGDKKEENELESIFHRLNKVEESKNTENKSEEKFDHTFFDDYSLTGKEREIIMRAKGKDKDLNELQDLHDNSSNIDQKGRDYIRKFMHK